jgi:hypothetical protein
MKPFAKMKNKRRATVIKQGDNNWEGRDLARTRTHGIFVNYIENFSMLSPSLIRASGLSKTGDQ